MLQVQQLQKAYGATTVLGGVSFVLNPGEHVGLVGSNGAGKSTLLRCLIGDERPDAGTIVRSPPELRLGYLAQSFDEWRERTVGQVLSEALAEWQVAATALHDATDRLAGESGCEAALAAYQAALDRFEALGGYGQGARRCSTDSVWATLLLQAPAVLLLDEPTNHLDVEGGYLDDLREVRGSVGSEY